MNEPTRKWLIGQLRRLSYKMPSKLGNERGKAFHAAKVGYGRYRCAHCADAFGPDDIALDHILPVVDPALGFQGWDSYIERLFVGAEGYQVLCHICHQKKTNLENSARRKAKKTKSPKVD